MEIMYCHVSILHIAARDITCFLLVVLILERRISKKKGKRKILTFFFR